MIIKQYINQTKTTIDITQYVASFSWNGSAKQTSRVLEIEVAYSPYDSQFKNITIGLGDLLKLYDDNKKLLFVGMVSSRERKSEAGTINYVSYDFLNHLLRSNGTYTFKDKTPEKIAKMVCDDLGIKTKNLAKTNVGILKWHIESDSYYNIILKAYKKAKARNGKKYMIAMDGTSLTVIEKGLSSGVTLRQDTNMTSSSYAENIDNMINQVVICDEKGKTIDVVNQESWTKKYGIFQDLYTREEKVNAKTAAKNMFMGIEKSASVEALGDVRCISGYSINIKDEATKLVGKFWIESDSHRWDNGKHTMSLQLNFQNEMDTGG